MMGPIERFESSRRPSIWAKTEVFFFDGRRVYSKSALVEAEPVSCLVEDKHGFSYNHVYDMRHFVTFDDEMKREVARIVTVVVDDKDKSHEQDWHFFTWDYIYNNKLEDAPFHTLVDRP